MTTALLCTGSFVSSSVSTPHAKFPPSWWRRVRMEEFSSEAFAMKSLFRHLEERSDTNSTLKIHFLAAIFEPAKIFFNSTESAGYASFQKNFT